MRTKASKPSIVAVNIDNDGSFVTPGRSLYVPGAEVSVIRAANMIDQNIDLLDLIISSDDTHHQDHQHIFYDLWWKNKLDQHPSAFHEMDYLDVLEGLWSPVFEKAWSVDYAQKLKHFTIWPYHCDENTADSQTVPVLAAAINRHAAFHNVKNITLKKGLNRRVEMYGIFGAEVEDPEDLSTKLNVDLIKTVASYDISLWFGQEDGHCVRRSREQYVRWCSQNQPEAIGKMRYVIDCVNTLRISPDYEQACRDSVDNMVSLGMKVIQSTDSLF